MLGFLDTFKLYIIVGLVIALAAGSGIHYIQVGALRNDLRAANIQVIELQTQIQSLSDSNLKLATEIKDQNAAIQAYVDAAFAAQTKADAAIRKAQEAVAQWRKRYEHILSAPPAVPADLCASTELRLSEYLEQRGGEAR